MSAQSYAILPEVMKTTHLNAEQYQTLYNYSIDAPEQFWSEQATKFISWFAPWSDVIQGDFTTAAVNWFKNGKLNACYNCLDRHLETRKNQVALIWEGNSPDDTESLTYEQLYERVCKFANILKSYGVKKGDRVGIYLPMIPEAVISMLACARIGAIHSVVFGGFSAQALATRLRDATCKLLITADSGMRGDKITPFKDNCDQALSSCPSVQTVIVVEHSKHPVTWSPARDVSYQQAMACASSDCPVEPMDANDPLFILYTSGSTGQPKGVLHNTGGYLLYAAMTHHYVFDYHDGDIHWCTADIGWITGHSYLVYGPLANGATTLLFEGTPNYPNYSRYWDIIDKHQVNIFYTAPTAIRALRREGDAWVTQTSRASLKILGTVGEPINPDVWEWYYHVVGNSRCPIVNTWWQTETGGIMLTDLPGATRAIPGAAGVPFFGVSYDIMDDFGKPLYNEAAGRLVITKPWPGMMCDIYGDKARFIETYFKPIPGHYLTGDGANRDKDGYIWISGRNDDVIKVSGHRLGTQELESALVSHPGISEAAVVSIAHAIKGEGIFAFVTTKIDTPPTDSLKKELTQHIRNKIGPLATPEEIQWVDALPKTRSGKIMRRILRNIANNELDTMGDISTLADTDVIAKIIKEKI